VNREQPHDPVFEQSVLSGVLWSPGGLDEVAGLLRSTDFYLPAHEVIWAVVLDMAKEGIPIDWATLPDQLKLRGQLEAVGGHLYLSKLAGVAASPASIGHYARRVADHALNRRLIERGTRIAEMGYGGGDASTNVSAAQAEILDMDTPASAHGRFIGEIVEEVMDAAESGNVAMPSMPFPYGADMPAMPCGRMVIVAGRPGSGKSTCALDAARHVGIHLGLPVAFFSLEMSQAEVGARTAAAEAKIPLPHVQKGEMTG
jgi:replicative DNA helicase